MKGMGRPIQRPRPVSLHCGQPNPSITLPNHGAAQLRRVWLTNGSWNRADRMSD